MRAGGRSNCGFGGECNDGGGGHSNRAAVGWRNGRAHSGVGDGGVTATHLLEQSPWCAGQNATRGPCNHTISAQCVARNGGEHSAATAPSGAVAFSIGGNGGDTSTGGANRADCQGATSNAEIGGSHNAAGAGCAIGGAAIRWRRTASGAIGSGDATLSGAIGRRHASGVICPAISFPIELVGHASSSNCQATSVQGRAHAQFACSPAARNYQGSQFVPYQRLLAIHGRGSEIPVVGRRLGHQSGLVLGARLQCRN